MLARHDATMSGELRILLLEDVSADAELAQNELRKAGIAFVARCVATEQGFLEELDGFRPDIILADYLLPNFDGMTALQLARARAPLTPVIIITGSINEETAVRCMKGGAADYVLKEHLIALPTAVKGALHNKHLKVERKRLVSDLKAKNVELERFAYTVSHDLKSPLFTIRGFLGLLRDSAVRGDLGQFEADMARIDEAASTMEELLSELLELSRIGRIVKPPEHVSLADLARDAVDLVAGDIAKRNATVEIKTDLPTVLADRVRLLEVFENLLSNAIKFAKDEAKPRVEIGTRRCTGETVYYVRDNGIGLDPEFRERIFGLFEQLDKSSAGTGVGLALVKRIIEVHGGQIWVESEGPGKGCAFCFTLRAETNSPSRAENETTWNSAKQEPVDSTFDRAP